MSSNVEQVKARLSVRDLVGSYVQLTRAGSNWKACCPFHHEKTPSFYVSPARDSWHCFGCDRGGDIFTFVEEYEGVDFLGALKELAGRAGVTLNFEGKHEKNEREGLKQALELATLFYEELLKRKGDVKDYLRVRGLTEETIMRYRLGYAPMGWHHLTEALIKRGVQKSTLEQCGLSIRNAKGELYDRFRGRIMFPLIDASGTVVGFTGRLAPGNTKDQDMGKYVNSPETPLYTKSKFLYGLREAKTAIREKGIAVLVEGQLDLLLSHQTGVLNTIAVSGTALTAEHLQCIGRLAETIIIAFDADLAGIKASERAFELALAQGLSVRAVLLPTGMDPADYAREKPQEWKKTIEKAEHLVTFLLRSVVGRSLSPEQKRKAVEEEVLPFVAALKSSIEQAQFIREIALELDVREEAVLQAVSAARHMQVNSYPEHTRIPSLPKATRLQEIAKRLTAILRWQEGSKDAVIDVTAIKKRFHDLLPETVVIDDNDVLAVEVAYGAGGDKMQKVVDEMLVFIEEELLAREMGELLKTMKTKGGDSPAVEVEKRYGELARRRVVLREENR